MVYDNSLEKPEDNKEARKKVVQTIFGNKCQQQRHLPPREKDRSRLAIPIGGKKVKIFKKRQDESHDLNDLNNEDGRAEPANMNKVNEDVEESD